MMPLIGLRPGRLRLAGSQASHVRVDGPFRTSRMSAAAPTDPGPMADDAPVDAVSAPPVDAPPPAPPADLPDHNGNQDLPVLPAAKPPPAVAAAQPAAGESFEDFTQLPDTNDLLAKLAKIRDSKQEVIDMLDDLKRESEDPDNMDKEQLLKLLAAYDGFKTQEEQYLALLEKVMVLKEAYNRTQAGLAALDAADGPADEAAGDKAKLPPHDLRVAGGLLAKMKAKSAVARAEGEGSGVAGPEGRGPSETASEAETGEETGPEPDELEALKNQRSLLQGMLAKQKALREKQARRNEEQMAASEELISSMHSETASVRSLVREQASSIAAKKAELEALKARLAQTKGLSTDIVAQVAHTDASGLLGPVEVEDESEVQGALERRAEELREKRQRMEALVGGVSALEASLDSDAASRPSVPDRSDDEPTDAERAVDEEFDTALQGFNQQYQELKSAREELVSLQAKAAQYLATGQAMPAELNDTIEQVLDGMALLEGGGLGSEGTQTPTPPSPPPPRRDLQALTMEELASSIQHNLGEQSSALDDIRTQQGRIDAVKGSAARVAATIDELARERAELVAQGRVLSKPASQRLHARSSFRPKSPPPTPPPAQPSSRNPQQQLPQEQIQQLQQHVDSMGGAAGLPQPPAQAQANEALSNQLILSQLLNCQQQIQLQSMEMRAMQGHLAELSFRGASAPPQPPQGPICAASEASNGSQTPVPEAQTPAAAQGPPQAYDGRPLSTGSLYNLLAPNPYLPFHLYNPGLLQAPMGNLVGGGPAGSESGRGAMGPGMAASVAGAASARHPWAPQPAQMNASWHPGLGGGPGSVPGGTRLSASMAFGGMGGRRHVESASESQPETIPEAREPREGSGVPGLDLRDSPFASPARRPPPPGLDQAQFDQLREQIYSEVAALISNNEDRPHFLLQLFRNLQLFSDDFLRAKAVQALQDQLSTFLDQPRPQGGERSAYLSATTFDITTDSQLSSEDERTARKVTPVLGGSGGAGALGSARPGHDYSEAVDSASSLSTPDEAAKPALGAPAEAPDSPLSGTALGMEVHGVLGPFLDQKSQGPASDQVLAYARKLVLGLVAHKAPQLASDGLATRLDAALAPFKDQRVGDVKDHLLLTLTQLLKALADTRAQPKAPAQPKAAAQPQAAAKAPAKASNKPTPKASPKKAAKEKTKDVAKVAAKGATGGEVKPAAKAVKGQGAGEGSTPRLPPLEKDGEVAVDASAALDSDIDTTLDPDDRRPKAIGRTASHPQQLDLQHEPHPEDHK